MRRAAASLALAAATATLASAQPAPRARPIAITRVTLIDVTGGTPRRDMTVVVTGDRITAVGPASRVRVPPAARIVNGAGRFLIPGLWDMHAHVDDQGAWAFPLYVANGVTGLRDMGSHLDRLDEWRAADRRGDALPRVVAAGPIVTGAVDDPDPRLVRVADSVAAERAVDSLVARGVNFIKVHDWLTAPAYGGMIAAARRHGVAVAGHVPVAIHPLDAAAAGQRSIEHQLSAWADYLVYASSRESTFVRRARVLIGKPFDPSRLIGSWPTSELDSLTASFDPVKADSLARSMARARTWHTPTLYVFSTIYLLPPDSAAALRSPRLRYVPQSLRASLPAMLADAAQLSRDPATLAARARVRDLHADMVRRLHRAGVPLLAGTDAVPVYPLTVPGFTLHDELLALVRAGVPAAAVLRAATLEPARYFGATDSLGTVEPGKVADLVLLDGNPLVDIRNTSRINAIILRGRLIDSGMRRQMLDGVARRAADR
jgi:cytosine/adenosine deaminase-related metal-dependent hydrolase